MEGRGECEEVRAASIFSPVLEGSAQGRSCRALGRSMGPFAHLTGVVVAWRDQFSLCHTVTLRLGPHSSVGLLPFEFRTARAASHVSQTPWIGASPWTVGACGGSSLECCQAEAQGSGSGSVALAQPPLLVLWARRSHLLLSPQSVSFPHSHASLKTWPCGG